MVYERSDSYVNTMSSIGKLGRDKTRSNEIGFDGILDKEILTQIYLAEGLGTTIVDAVADDGIKKGWTYLNDDEERIKKELDNLMFDFKIAEAWKYARLYGGAVLVMITQKGDLEKPLNLNNGPITQFRPYSMARMNLTSTDIIADPKSPYFEDVEVFKIRKLDGNFLHVHRSRCLAIYGDMAPDYNISNLPIENQYWGLSTLQRTWDRLSYYGTTEQAIANLMQEVTIGKYTLSNLSKVLAMNNADAVKTIMTRLEVMASAKSIINGVILGADEKYERDTLNLTGVGDIVDRQQANLSAVCGIPVTRLFGISPGGMNSTGESDLRNYYDKVHRSQVKNKFEFNRAVKYVAGYVYNTKNLQDYGIDEFLNLKEMSDKEKAEIYKINAEADSIYVNNIGALSSEEVRQERFPDKDQDIQGMIDPEEVDE